MSDILTINNISKKYNNRSIIENLSFSIKQGEMTTLFARSGAGKSTLIKILAGLDKDFTGDFSFTTTKVSIIFQKLRLFPYKTVKENILYPFKIVDKKYPKDSYNEWLNIIELEEYEDSYPHELSEGMKAKLSLMRAFLTSPEFIIMDEPFKSIDIKSEKKIIDFFKHKYPNITALVVSHSLDDIMLFSKLTVLTFKKHNLSEYESFTVDTDSKEQGDIEKISTVFKEIYNF